MTLNISNFEKLLSWLDAGAPHFVFDMDHGLDYVEQVRDIEALLAYSNQRDKAACGTVCCIAGAAQLMSLAPEGELFPSPEDQQRLVDYADWTNTRDLALAWLGLPSNNDPLGHDLFSFALAPNNCTPQQAAAAVRRVMAGQEPWK